MPTAGVSGLAIATATAGGVLLTAAIRNQTPIDVVKTVLKRPTSGTALGSSFSSIASGVGKLAASQTAASAVGSAVGTAISGVGSAVLVAEARKHLGAKYVFATAGPVTFDCSGLVVYCLRQTIMPSCPRFTTYNASAVLAAAGWHKITPAQFQAGDIIIRSGHMGIASSPTTYVNAPHAGTVVKEVRIPTKGVGWWGYRR
jgi:cell wall-associated NlpC family hydrolase